MKSVLCQICLAAANDTMQLNQCHLRRFLMVSMETYFSILAGCGGRGFSIHYALSANSNS